MIDPRPITPDFWNCLPVQSLSTQAKQQGMSSECTEPQGREQSRDGRTAHKQVPAREITPPLIVDGPEAVRDSHC